MRHLAHQARDALIKKLKPQLIIASQSDQVVGTSMSDSAWASGSVDKLKSLAALSKSRVVYIEDSNNDPQDALSCMERNPSNAPEMHVRAPDHASLSRIAHQPFRRRFRRRIRLPGNDRLVLQFSCLPTHRKEHCRSS